MSNPYHYNPFWNEFYLSGFKRRPEGNFTIETVSSVNGRYHYSFLKRAWKINKAKWAKQ